MGSPLLIKVFIRTISQVLLVLLATAGIAIEAMMAASIILKMPYMRSSKRIILMQELFWKAKMLQVAKILSQMSIFPVDVESLSPSYLLKSPSFGAKMMEINLK